MRQGVSASASTFGNISPLNGAIKRRDLALVRLLLYSDTPSTYEYARSVALAILGGFEEAIEELLASKPPELIKAQFYDFLHDASFLGNTLFPALTTSLL